MSGATPLLLLDVIMAWIKITLSFLALLFSQSIKLERLGKEE
jgi:hypothetical protein